MGRRSRLALISVGAGTIVLACNAVLGLDERPRAPDGADAGAGGQGVGGESGTDGAGGSTSGNGGEAGSRGASEGGKGVGGEGGRDAGAGPVSGADSGGVSEGGKGAGGAAGTDAGSGAASGAEIGGMSGGAETDGGSAGAETSGGSAGADSCDDGSHTCLELPPVGWSGPVALVTGSATAGAPSCSGTGYEQPVLSLFGDLDEGNPTCGCTCGDPPGMSCGAVPIQRSGVSAPCQSVGVDVDDDPEYSVASGQCVEGLDGYLFKPMYPVFSASGACTATPTTDIETPEWSSRMAACETDAAVAAGCPEQELCMPDLQSPLETWCVYREGEVSCPSGSYSERTLYYEDFDDERSCSICTCDTPTGLCQGFLELTDSCDPVPTFLDSAPFGSCVVIESAPSVYLTASVTTIDGQCDPIGGELQGSVALSGAVTACCRP